MLRRRPLDVVQPEDDDPLSLLLTLAQIDDLKLKAQWLRDAAIYRLHADLKAGDAQIAALDADDMRSTKDETKIRLDRSGPEADRWTVLGAETQKALEAMGRRTGRKGRPALRPALGGRALPSGFRPPKSPRLSSVPGARSRARTSRARSSSSRA